MYPITHCNNYATGSFTAKIEIKGSRGIINDHEYTKKRRDESVNLFENHGHKK